MEATDIYKSLELKLLNYKYYSIFAPSKILVHYTKTIRNAE